MMMSMINKIPKERARSEY